MTEEQERAQLTNEIAALVAEFAKRLATAQKMFATPSRLTANGTPVMVIGEYLEDGSCRPLAVLMTPSMVPEVEVPSGFKDAGDVATEQAEPIGWVQQGGDA
jgi:hypothetical protein